MTTYEICAVPSYKVNYDNSRKYKNNINVVATLCNQNMGFHERLNKTDILKLSVDIDKLKIKKPSATFDRVIEDICSYIGITENDISYTTNFGEESGSHHIVIPKYCMSSTEQKLLWANFRKKYKYGKEIDAEIFDKDGWFRLPNQTNEQKKTAHTIIKGNMEDFILKYVEGCETYKPKKEPKKILIVEDDDEEELENEVVSSDETIVEPFADAEDTEDKYLELLFDVIGNKKGNKVIDWDVWFQIAGVLKSNKYSFEIFDKYSKLNEKIYSKNTTLLTWNGIKKEEMSIYTLQNIAKKVNKKKYVAWLNKWDEAKNAFDEVAEEFEKQHAKIISKSIFVKTFDNEVIVMNRQALKTSYEHMVYIKTDKNGDEVEVNFINDWLTNNPTQRCYDNVGVYPNASLCPKNIFNMWRKFDMELVTTYTENKEALKEILLHIKILCNREENTYNYLIAWISQMIQYPEIKSVCPTFISQEGAGKGTLMRLFEKMLGKNKVFETTNPARDVWGDFNGRMANTFLINLNELSKKDTLECEGKIKGLITDPYITINNKGINQYDIESHHRFMISTNNEEPINTSKDDRRKVIIRCSDELIGNKTHFEKMYKYLDDVDVIKTCYEYFKNYKIKKIIDEKEQDVDMKYFDKIPLPITEYHKELQSYSVSPIELWLKDWIENYDGKEKEVSRKINEWYSSFEEWKHKTNLKYDCDIKKFPVRLCRLKIDGITKKPTKDCNMTCFDVDKIKKHLGIGLLLELPV